MRQVLISGYYGFHNIGDEAVLGGILAGLREALPEVEPVVLSARPEETTRLHGVAAIPRMDRRAIAAELAHTDLFISGGGSLLQDVTSFRSPLYYLGVLWLAQRAHVPTMMLAQGVGPLRNPLNRLLARRVLNRMRMITVRDQGSADYLLRMGVDRPPIEVTADPSFLLSPDNSARLQEWWAAHIPEGRAVIGVALRRWEEGIAEERYTAIADALATLAEETGALILFLPMQFADDLPIAEEIAGWTPAESRVLDLALSPCEMLAAVGQVDMILAMRLHTLIFAVQQGTAAFGIAYDPKVADFAAAAKLPPTIAWNDLQADTLTTALQQCWNEREAQRATLAASAANLTTLARWNFSRIKELLG